jgi:ornithine cyclodeaminase
VSEFDAAPGSGTIRYVGIGEICQLVQSLGVESMLSSLARYIRDDYVRWNDFGKSVRLASHSRNGVIELMPISDHTLYSFKFVNGHPNNTATGRQTVVAFGVLAEIATGYPLLLSELTISTALRTAATSALAASAMARPGATSMALIGCGAQSEFQVLAFKALLGTREIRAFDIDDSATDKLFGNLRGIPGLSLVKAASIHEAVRGAAIVTTITADKNNATILTPDMIEPGMHINAVGGDCPGKTELHPDVVAAAHVVVQYEPQTRIEGEIQQMAPDFPIIELWRVLAGLERGRNSDEQVTVFDSVGFALEDFSTLRYIRDLAEGQAAARRIDLLPPTGIDPKNLYRLVMGPSSSRSLAQE